MKTLHKWKWAALLLVVLGLSLWPVMATDLETNDLNATDRVQFALDKITQDITSTLYDGGGTANALEVDTDTDGIVASGAAVIDAGGANAIDVWLSNTTVTQNATFYIAEFSASTPTAVTCIRITEVAIPDADRTLLADRANWGLTAATDHYVKLPVRIAITPGSYLMMGMAASEGGTWYARYTMLASMDASRADINTNTAADLASIATDADAIKTATEGAEDELDGTTTTGPLAKAVHGGKTLIYAEITAANGDVTGGTDNTTAIIADPGSGNEIYIVEIMIMVNVQSQLVFTDGSENKHTAIPQFSLPAYGGFHLKRDHGYRFVSDSNEGLFMDDLLAGTVDVRGYIWYYVE